MIAKPFTSDTERWDAVQNRADVADGSFVYAVRTTGIFCRPSCASRLPRRANVQFFDVGAEAIRAGYRACKRCKPTEAHPKTDADRLIVAACRLLEEEGARRTQDVARELGISQFYFARLFKAKVGVTPQEYRRRVVAERAKGGIARATSVTRAIYDAGYSSSSRFYDGVARELGMTAKDARSGAEGQRVAYAIRRCSLGRILIAWTARGVCDVRFGETDDALTSELAKRFPRAIVAREDIPAWVDDVVDAVERPRASTIPLDIHGTAFQARVWRELARIPAGETRTYAEIARTLGSSNLARAVAGACAANSIAVLVPCHRVVRSDGDVSGYRWGVARKKTLLRREAARR